MADEKLAARRGFHERLLLAMDDAGLSRSELARRVGIDRSTLSQILSTEGNRLPRADTVAAMAANLRVSLDWLMGLSQKRHGEISADILARSLEITSGEREAASEALARWHGEAAGYKIRYVPSTLPDQLKSEAVIAYEFGLSPRPGAEEAQLHAAQRLADSRSPDSDIEVCSSFQSLLSFARGEGMWAELGWPERRQQLLDMTALVDELYPRFRWFLFDGRARHSAAITIFGPRRAVIYVGDVYFVFNTTGHIRALSDHFDNLVRSAVVQSTEIVDYIRQNLPTE